MSIMSKEADKSSNTSITVSEGLNALVYHSVPLVEQFLCYDTSYRLIRRYPWGGLLQDGQQFVGLQFFLSVFLEKLIWRPVYSVL